MKELPISPEILLQTVAEAVGEGRSIIVAGSGNSMRPFIRPETDKLLLTPMPERSLLPGDIVLYCRPNGQAVIHRVYRVRGERCDMLGDNQYWVERGVPRRVMLAYVKEVLRPEGSFDCDTDGARREACREMRRRQRNAKPSRLRHYAGAVKRRIRNLLK